MFQFICPPTGKCVITELTRHLQMELIELDNVCMCVCFSVEMMGHPELLSECDINQLEPLLPQDVVDDLLSKYVQTFTVSTAHINRNTNGGPIQVI